MTYEIQRLEQLHPEYFGDNGGYGRAFGILNCSFAFGGMIGPALSGVVIASAGWTVLCLGMSAINAIDLLLVVHLLILNLTEVLMSRSGPSLATYLFIMEVQMSMRSQLLHK